MPEPLDLDILPSSENIPMNHEVFEVKILSFLLDDKNEQDLKNVFYSQCFLFQLLTKAPCST